MLIEASQEEITALRQLLHRACLHSGMDVAEVAVYWNNKLIAALQQTEEKPDGKVETNGSALPVRETSGP